MHHLPLPYDHRFFHPFYAGANTRVAWRGTGKGEEGAVGVCGSAGLAFPGWTVLA